MRCFGLSANTLAYFLAKQLLASHPRASAPATAVDGPAVALVRCISTATAANSVDVEGGPLASTDRSRSTDRGGTAVALADALAARARRASRAQRTALLFGALPTWLNIALAHLEQKTLQINIYRTRYEYI